MQRILIYSFIFVSRLVFGNSDDLKSLLTADENNFKTVQPLCLKRSIAKRIGPCEDKKSFPACLHVPTGTIQLCRFKLKETVPLCYIPFFKPHYVLKCDKPSTHICMSPRTDVKAFSVCQDSSVKVCLKNDSLEACKGRFKRQEINFPKLDVDGYYASCENCDLNVKMILDESSDERPIIQLESVPLKKGEKSQDD